MTTMLEAPAGVVSYGTKAEEIAETFAVRLRAAGYTVKIEVSYEEGFVLSSGEWVTPDNVRVYLSANRRWYDASLYLVWRTRVEGASRKTTRRCFAEVYQVSKTRKIRSARALHSWMNVLCDR